MSKKPKRPRDPNQLAKFVVDLVTGEALPDPEPDAGKSRAALAGVYVVLQRRFESGDSGAAEGHGDHQP